MQTECSLRPSRSMAGNELFERLELLLVWDSSKSAVKTLCRCVDAVWSNVRAPPLKWMPALWEMCAWSV